MRPAVSALDASTPAHRGCEHLKADSWTPRHSELRGLKGEGEIIAAFLARATLEKIRSFLFKRPR